MTHYMLWQRKREIEIMYKNKELSCSYTVHGVAKQQNESREFGKRLLSAWQHLATHVASS